MFSFVHVGRAVIRSKIQWAFASMTVIQCNGAFCNMCTGGRAYAHAGNTCGQPNKDVAFCISYRMYTLPLCLLCWNAYSLAKNNFLCDNSQTTSLAHAMSHRESLWTS